MNQKQGTLKIIHTDAAQYYGLYYNPTYEKYYPFVGEDIFYQRAMKGVLPIILTDDSIEVGDKYLSGNIGSKLILERYASEPQEGSQKILVLPEQIPQNIIDAIVNHKLVDGDVVSVELYELMGETSFFYANRDNTPKNCGVKLQKGKATVRIPASINDIITAADTSEFVDELRNYNRLLSQNGGKEKHTLSEMSEENKAIVRANEIEKNRLQQERSTSDIEEAFKQYQIETNPDGRHTIADYDLWKAAVRWAYDNPKPIEPDIQKASSRYHTEGLRHAYELGRTDERQLSGNMYSEKEVKSLVMSAISRYAGFIPESTRKGHEKSIQYWFEQNKKK